MSETHDAEMTAILDEAETTLAAAWALIERAEATKAQDCHLDQESRASLAKLAGALEDLSEALTDLDEPILADRLLGALRRAQRLRGRSGEAS